MRRPGQPAARLPGPDRRHRRRRPPSRRPSRPRRRRPQPARLARRGRRPAGGADPGRPDRPARRRRRPRRPGRRHPRRPGRRRHHHGRHPPGLDLGAVPTWSALIPTAGPPFAAGDPFDGPASEPVVRVGGSFEVPASGPVVQAGGSFGAVDPFAGPSPEPVVRGVDPVPGSSPGPLVAAPAPARGLSGDLLPVGAATTATADSLGAASLVNLLAEPWAGMSVLPLAGLADGGADPRPEPWVVEHVLEVARTAYRVTVVDLPATDEPSVATALSQADALVVVGRCETAGVRGLQAAIDTWVASGRDPDAAGAVVTGVRPRAPLAPREVRAALGDRLWGLIPTAAAELAAAADDGTLLLDRHDLSAVQAMVTLANRVVPFAAVTT